MKIVPTFSTCHYELVHMCVSWCLQQSWQNYFWLIIDFWFFAFYSWKVSLQFALLGLHHTSIFSYNIKVWGWKKLRFFVNQRFLVWMWSLRPVVNNLFQVATNFLKMKFWQHTSIYLTLFKHLIISEKLSIFSFITKI